MRMLITREYFGSSSSRRPNFRNHHHDLWLCSPAYCSPYDRERLGFLYEEPPRTRSYRHALRVSDPVRLRSRFDGGFPAVLS